ncbi:MAG TPA: flagellar biosynthesis protein FlgJ [Alphaproteobacteria bacterium]|mgnify:FL=1|nr:flagellar biosynthesis protein FlgJ [Alphaproteobacteria bacterium]
MSTVNNNQSLNNILDKLGIQQQEEKKRADGGALGQEDFLKLMTTQLQNQDPFAPMENADFIAQMAQFSTVTGITDMGQSLKGISNQLSEFRIATATNMLGNSVLVPGTRAYPDGDGAVHGVIDLPAASGTTNVVFTSQNGDILHVEELGAQPSGLAGFSWQDIPQNVLDSNDYINVEAFADQGGGLEGVSTSVFGEVLAASTSSADGVMLDVKGYGDINVNEVVRFRHN